MKLIQPYLTFNGNCREAMDFYKACIGGDLMITTFGEGMAGHCAPGSEGLIMHARLVHGETVLMASDNMPDWPYTVGTNVSVSITCDSDDEVETAYNAMSEGGARTMPPDDAPWGARFGMLTDKYGFHWMLQHDKTPPA